MSRVMDIYIYSIYNIYIDIIVFISEIEMPALLDDQGQRTKPQGATVAAFSLWLSFKCHPKPTEIPGPDFLQ